MDFDPAVFGQGFHHFVESEYQMFGPVLAPLLHVTSFIMILLVFWLGNKARFPFTVLFALNWLFLFGYWGIYAIVYWARIGVVYLLAYMAAPVLLAFILANWIRELFQKRIDLDFKNTPKLRWIVVVPIMIWGFWYPSYIYGQGFALGFKDLLFSCYGLMPCPTTMVVLSLFALNYPRGNRTLFHLMTTYAVFIGTATVITGWFPDIPFILIGLYAVGLILAVRFRNFRGGRLSRLESITRESGAKQ